MSEFSTRDYTNGYKDGALFSETTIEALRAENEKLRAALLAFAKHFGPLEDNIMLHEGVRECFRLARAALEGK